MTTNLNPLGYTGRVFGSTNNAGVNQYDPNDFTVDQYGVVHSASNAKIISNGTATLVAGTVTVPLTSIAASDILVPVRNGVNASTALGELNYSISAGVSFTVTALNPTNATTQTGDLSTIQYLVVRPT